MRRQTSKPNLADCKASDSLKLDGTREIREDWCITHRQESAACIQMAQGNLCHICLDWHQPPNCVDVKCECPNPSDDHAAGECNNRAYWILERDGKEIRVCGACNLSEDKNVRKLNPPVPF